MLRRYRSSALWILLVCSVGLALIDALAVAALPRATAAAVPGPDRAPARVRIALTGTPCPSPLLGHPQATPSLQPTPLPTLRPSLVCEGSLKEERLGRSEGLHGRLLERSFHSRALNRDMPYLIYLPPGYGHPRRYPTLYMLHGRGGQRGEWAIIGLVDSADRGIHDGSITPMLIVFPEGLLGYWTNHTGNGPCWGDYLHEDLVAQVDASYRTIRSPTARAIGGMSMGGWGALHAAFTHPDVFGIVGAHSPALRPDDGSLSFLGTGPEFASKNPMSLAGSIPPAGCPQIWIDTGQDDPWAARATLLHDTLAGRGIAHTWHLYPGGHNWDYWRAHVDEYLRYYSDAFARGNPFLDIPAQKD